MTGPRPAGAQRPLAPGPAVLLAVWGFLLPLTALVRIESLALHLTPLAIAETYGTAWLAHAPLALGGAALAALLARLAGPGRLARALPAAALAGGFLFAVALGAREVVAPAVDARLPSTLALALASALAGLLLGLWQPALATSARPVALALTVAGGIAALGALAAALARPSPPPAGPPADAARPDILLITLDALAAPHLSAHGHDRPTSPAIDALARRGVRFEQMTAGANFTAPALATLMTGRHVWRHGAWHLKAAVLPEAAAHSLPARLRAAGWSVRAVTTNPYGGVHKLGLGQHFDAVAADRMPLRYSCLDAAARWLPRACPAVDIGLTGLIRIRNSRLLGMLGRFGPGRHFDARIGLADAGRLLERGADGRPVFLWVHLMPPHDPFAAPPTFLGRFDPSPARRSWRDTDIAYGFAFARQRAEHALLRARYDEAIAAVDADLGAFLERLERSGRLARTIVLVSADHGELFRPDYGGHSGPALYQNVLHVPLVAAGPGIARGVVVAGTVAQVDLAPTILELAGAGPAPGSWDGRSLAPALRGQPLAARPAFAVALERASRFKTPSTGSATIVDGRWKLVRFWGRARDAQRARLTAGLFDLVRDPAEARDLGAEQPARAAAMATALDQALARAP